MVVDYLILKEGELILDCCVVFGGKMAYILEYIVDIEVVVIDSDVICFECVYDNFECL